MQLIGGTVSKSKQPNHKPLSNLALSLLADMAKYPDRIEYNTRPLGGAFLSEDLSLLDDAYVELQRAGLVEPANDTVSFFGKHKSAYILTHKGMARAKEIAA